MMKILLLLSVWLGLSLNAHADFYQDILDWLTPIAGTYSLTGSKGCENVEIGFTGDDNRKVFMKLDGRKIVLLSDYTPKHQHLDYGYYRFDIRDLPNIFRVRRYIIKKDEHGALLRFHIHQHWNPKEYFNYHCYAE